MPPSRLTEHRTTTNTSLPYISNSSIISLNPQFIDGSQNILTGQRQWFEKRPGFSSLFIGSLIAETLGATVAFSGSGTLEVGWWRFVIFQLNDTTLAVNARNSVSQYSDGTSGSIVVTINDQSYAYKIYYQSPGVEWKWNFFTSAQVTGSYDIGLIL